MKHLAILVPMLAGGFLWGMTAYEINIAWAPESAPTAQHSTPAHQPVSEIGRTGASRAAAPSVATEAPPVATVQEVQLTSAPATGPAQKQSSRVSHKHPQK